MMEEVFFYIFAFVAVVSAIGVVSARSAIHSAFYLIVCLLQVAALFILLRAPFLAAVQVFIYVGAVMVLFLFAVLVIDIGREKFKEHLHGQSVPAVGAVLALFVVMGVMIWNGRLTAPLGRYTEAVLSRNTEVVGRALYTKYIYPFEVVSIVLLIALIGAIVLVMRDRARDRGKEKGRTQP